MLEEALKYSIQNKRKYDIIAAWGMCELGDEEMSVKKPEAREPQAKQFQDIGWWKDAKGYKHYGAIPKTNEDRHARERISKQDSWLYENLV